MTTSYEMYNNSIGKRDPSVQKIIRAWRTFSISQKEGFNYSKCNQDIKTRTFEKFEPPAWLRARLSIVGARAAATIHGMSSVHFLCHFGTCCQGCNGALLYVHLMAGARGARASSCGLVRPRHVHNHHYLARSPGPDTRDTANRSSAR